MPLEIKEVVIKTSIQSESNQTDKSEDNLVSDDTKINSEDINRIVAECVDQVIEILNSKSER